jgi:hypothetical protein
VRCGVGCQHVFHLPHLFGFLGFCWCGRWLLCGLWDMWLRFSFLILPFPRPLIHLFFFSHEFLHEGEEVVRLGRYYFNFSDALCIQPVLNLDHGGLLFSGLKWELFLLAADVEANLSGSNIDLCPCSAQEWPPKDEHRFLRYFHVEHHEVDRDEVFSDSHWDVLCNTLWIPDRGVGQLKMHRCWCEMSEV